MLAGTSRPLTGREIAKLLGRQSHSGVGDALRRLVGQGLVQQEEAGRAFLFTLNREHLAAGAAEHLFDLRVELLHRIRDSVETWEIAPAHLSLFGSAARGDGGVDSDIDLFVVRPQEIDQQDEVWREQLDLIARQAEAWTGNPVRIVEVGGGEIQRLREARPTIVEELRADAIALAGPEASVLLEEV